MQPFQLLIKPVSGMCNLSCDYCFYLDMPERCYPDKSDTIMSNRILRKLIESYLQLGFSPSVFSWQGGEPTLAGLDFFRNVVELQAKLGSNQRIGNALQTNGILIDEDWAKLLAKYRFLVGLSIDGPMQIHDSSRGDGTWKKAMNCADLFEEYGVQFNILTVVHQGNVTNAREIYQFHREQGFNHLQFIPAVDIDKKSGKLKSHSIQPKDYGTFLCDVFDEWVRNGDIGRIRIRLFDAILENLAGRFITSLCTLSEQCGRYLVVEHNGDIYPCDFYVFREHSLGNLADTSWKELLNRRVSFEQQKGAAEESCGDCPWWSLCHGGCPKNRIEGDQTYLCDGYKSFFSHIRGWLESVASQM